MGASDGSPQYDDYLRLVTEYQEGVSRCIAGLEHLRRTQRELRDVAAALHFDSARFDAVSEIEKTLGQILGNQGDDTEVKLGGLSRREREVFTSIGRGLTSHEIAEKFGLAVSTVETYRERLKSKLHLNSGVSLTRCAILWAFRHPEAASADVPTKVQ